MNERCVIIGSTGFVGRWLRAALVQARFAVVGFDTRPAGVRDEVIADVFDATALEHACAGAKVVCHLAALQSSRQHTWDDFYTANVRTTERIVAECLRAGVEHLVYFSTELVYGKQYTDRVGEDAPLRPRGFYGKSKAMAEELCSKHEGRGLRVTILRPSNIIGPGKTRVVDQLFDRVSRGAPIPLVGGRHRRMQVIDVRDVARITARIFTERLSGVYNLAASSPTTAFKAYSELIAHARSTSRLIPVPAHLFRGACTALDLLRLSPLTPEQYHRLADSWIVDPSKLMRHIPCTLEHDGATSLLDTYDAYAVDGLPKPVESHVRPVHSSAVRSAGCMPSRPLLFEGQVVIVTGASRGIGRATARAFAQHGARVVLVGRHAEALEQARHDIEAAGSQAIAVLADVRDDGQVRTFVQAALATWHRIDVLVNNAGVTAVAPLVDTDIEHIREILDVNLTGTILCIRAVVPHFMTQRGGHIVNVASILGKRGVPGQAVYSASKAAILRLSEALRSELAPYGITVTSFCPSSTSTAMNARATAGDRPLKHLIRRVFTVTPEAVAQQIVRATARRRREVVLSLPAKAIAVLNAVCPSLLDRLFARLDRP